MSFNRRVRRSRRRPSDQHPQAPPPAPVDPPHMRIHNLREILKAGLKDDSKRLYFGCMKVRVVKMTPFGKLGGQRLRASFADATGAVRAWIWVPTTVSFTEGQYIVISKFVYKRKHIIIDWNTRINILAGHPDSTPASCVERAERLFATPVNPVISLSAVKKSLITSRVSFRGYIRHIGNLKEVQAGRYRETVREMTIRDENGISLMVRLWGRAMDTVPVMRPGQKMEVWDALVSDDPEHKEPYASVYHMEHIMLTGSQPVTLQAHMAACGDFAHGSIDLNFDTETTYVHGYIAEDLLLRAVNRETLTVDEIVNELLPLPVEIAMDNLRVISMTVKQSGE